MSCQVIFIHLGSFYSSSVALGSPFYFQCTTFSHDLRLPKGETGETYMIEIVGYFLLHIFCHLYQKMLIWPMSDKQLKIWKDWHQPNVFTFNRALQSQKHREPYCSHKNLSVDFKSCHFARPITWLMTHGTCLTLSNQMLSELGRTLIVVH